MDQPRILIVGAGPVGLALAMLLTRHKINYEIIDKNLKRSNYSRALAMHARTLELFDQIGVSQDFIQAGNPIHEGHLFADGKPLLDLDLSKIPSKFNYVLSISQSVTEEVLENLLNKEGKEILRGSELAEIKNTKSPIQVKIIDQNKQIQEKTYDYVLSCEGAHSVIRKQCGFSFKGGSYKESFLLADVELDSSLNPNSIYGFLAPWNLLAMIAFIQNQKTYWRLITTLDGNYKKDPSTINIDDIKLFCKNLIPKDLRIKDCIWISNFHVHHRIVNRYSKDNVFLLGDAAHIHSPLGGQGMNAGIHDAFNLADKLTAVIKENANPQILDNYNLERRAAGQKIVNGTDLATRIVFGRNPLMHNLQKFLVPKLMNDRTKVKLATALSMLA